MDEIIKKLGLYSLPAYASSSEYAGLINAMLKARYPHHPGLSKPRITRSLQRLGFQPVGRDRHGCLTLFNPHHSPRII